MKVSLHGIGDAHVHLRQNSHIESGEKKETALLDFAVSHIETWADFYLPMPNLIPSIKTGTDALQYAQDIREARKYEDAHVIKCIKAVEGFTTPEIIKEASNVGVSAIKIYFEGVTTNATHGDAVSWDGFFEMLDVWKACERFDMVVNIHAERPGVFSMRREHAAHEAVTWLVENCPKLRIVIEHVTDRRTINLIENLPENVRCTITAHHLWGDLDMVVGSNLNPHSFCKPIAKEPEDTSALRKAMMSGNPKFMFGSDSAPHSVNNKISEGCAGVFTSPFCPQYIAHILEEEKCANIENIMQVFMGDSIRDFYRIPTQKQRIVILEQKTFDIPSVMYTSTGVPIVPFLAGTSLNWSLKSVL